MYLLGLSASANASVSVGINQSAWRRRISYHVQVCMPSFAGGLLLSFKLVAVAEYAFSHCLDDHLSWSGSRLAGAGGGGGGMRRSCAVAGGM